MVLRQPFVVSDRIGVFMVQTMLTLDEDLAQEIRGLSQKLSKSFKSLVNESLRLGLKQIKKPFSNKAYRTKPHAMGLKKGCQLNNIQDLLSELEGEDKR